MRLIALLIGLFMGVFPIIAFAWGFYEGLERRPPCGSVWGRP